MIDEEIDRLTADARRLISEGCEELPRTGPHRIVYQARCLAVLEALAAELRTCAEPRRVVRGICNGPAD